MRISDWSSDVCSSDLLDRCPHKHGRLSQGIVHGGAVACPLHNWRISLSTGEALGEDKGCTPTVPVKIDGGRVLICRASTLKAAARSEEHTSELQSLMRISYAVFCLKKKIYQKKNTKQYKHHKWQKATQNL